MTDTLNTVHHGDCVRVLTCLPENSVDLIVTSPPYLDARADQYKSVKEDAYVDWWMMRAAHFWRVLKPTGSLVVNIKERARNMRRSTYVYQMVIEMTATRGDGSCPWLWVEEYPWVKTNYYPCYQKKRLPDAFERCLHFAKTRRYKFFPEAPPLQQPKTATTLERQRRYPETSEKKPSRTGSPFKLNAKARVDTTTKVPCNVIQAAPQTSFVGHSAPFPETLPTFFIHLMTQPGDIVLDPFAGSGTTCVAAKRQGRRWVGVEIEERHVEIARRRIEGTRASA